MSVVVTNIQMPVDAELNDLPKLMNAQLNIPAKEVRSFRVVRMSLDARKKQDIHYVVSAVVQLSESLQKTVLKRNDKRIALYKREEKREIVHGKAELKGRVVVVGMGPGGLFAAYLLAREGYSPLVIDRGDAVEKRTAVVENFWTKGILNEESNVMFGEGGAGAFSDGKLTTRIKDARAQDVLDILVQQGAPAETAYQAKPHVGTDILRNVVANLRKKIISLGGEVRFNACLTDLVAENGELRAVKIRRNGSEEKIPCSACILATGQGARDIYRMLIEKKIQLLPKPFAVGVRIEHPQMLINKAQFGALADHPRLGAAEYQLTTRSGERGVYTFCMCPGGQVIASSSAEGEIVVNGMSYHERNGQNANAAVVVQVTPEDYGADALAAIRFQRNLEKRAFEATEGYMAPAERVADFLQNTKPKGFSAVKPTYRPGVVPYQLKKCLPDFVSEGIKVAVQDFGRKLHGYDFPDAVLTAVESRTSSPVRILRDESGQTPNMRWVYPVGEGAGYAGGIMSAAVDGLKAAEHVIETFAAPIQ